MGKFAQNDTADDSDDVVVCRNLARGLLLKHYDFHAYAENVTRVMIYAGEDSWSSCLDTIPPDLVPPYLQYLRAEVEACDFKPFPGDSLFGGELEVDIERIKLELRPKYVAHVEFAKSKLEK